MNRVKAVALCRVSTSKQRIHGTSLEAQEKRIYKAAELLEVELDEDHIWRKDISSRKGKNLKRPDLLEIHGTCKRDRTIKYFIVDEPDRFMRSIKEYYWWQVEFERIGVRVVFANNPLVSEEDQYAIFDEMINIYRAESSNHERSTKTKDKMQSRIDDGYYPGHQHLGYKKSDVRGLHVPHEPNFSILQQGMKDLAYGKKTTREALTWMTLQGLKLPSGKEVQMDKLRRILREPYYYGAVVMGNFKPNQKALHQPMITQDEFERVERLSRGLKVKFRVNRHNPDFPMNGMICERCHTEQKPAAKLTGYTNNNGKKGNSRRYYSRYHCRSCGTSYRRSDIHDEVSKFMESLSVNESARGKLLEALRSAWNESKADSIREVAVLRTRLLNEQAVKGQLIVSLATSPALREDIEQAINIKKATIKEIENQIEAAEDIDKEFETFCAFALEFVENLKQHWWELDHDNRLRCEQLLFPELLRITPRGKVSTPKLSPIYRYESTKKAPVGALEVSYGGPGGT